MLMLKNFHCYYFSETIPGFSKLWQFASEVWCVDLIIWLYLKPLSKFYDRKFYLISLPIFMVFKFRYFILKGTTDKCVFVLNINKSNFVLKCILKQLLIVNNNNYYFSYCHSLYHCHASWVNFLLLWVQKGDAVGEAVGRAVLGLLVSTLHFTSWLSVTVLLVLDT